MGKETYSVRVFGLSASLFRLLQILWQELTSSTCRINVAAPSALDDGSEGSLASSSIVMPASANGPLSQMAIQSTAGMSTSSVTEPTVAPSEAEDSDSASLISIPSSNDDDESAWEDSRSQVIVSPPVEYVVLYDSSSDEE